MVTRRSDVRRRLNVAVWCRGGWRGLGSDAEEDASAPEPEAAEPDEGEDDEAFGDGGMEAEQDFPGVFARVENGGTAPGEEEGIEVVGGIGLEEAFPEVGDDVGEDGVHADHDEWEHGAMPLADVGDEVESGEEECAPTATDEDPGGGPDAFDAGADAGEVEKGAEAEGGEAGDDEGADSGEVWEILATEPLAGEEAEDHGGEGGDEAEGDVAAAIEEPGFLAWEKVEEPEIEVVGWVGI